MSDHEELCFQCDTPDESRAHYKCPVCHKRFCEDHAYVMSGRSFCSKGCSQYFFFSDPDD